MIDLINQYHGDLNQLDDKVYYERLLSLKRKNEKKECVVLSCGPSLGIFKEEVIRDFCSDKFVIAIKLALFRYRDIVDVAMFNACNLPYSNNGIYYKFGDIFSIGSSCFPKHTLLPKQYCDVFLQVTNPFEEGLKQESFLCFNRDYENNTLEKTLKRKCFPGIMGEACIPFIEYMGFEKFYTIGWDLTNTEVNSENYKHFWDENIELTMKGNPGALPWDNIANIEASRSLNEWLLSKNIQWEIIGDSCLDKSIPRFSL